MTVSASSIVLRATDVLADNASIRWTARELVRWLNDAQREIVVLRPDSTTTTVTATLTAGARQNLRTMALALPPVKLDEITRNMAATSQKLAVTQVPRYQLDAQLPGWTAVAGTVDIVHFMFDPRDPCAFYVYPPALGTAQLELTYTAASTDVAEPAVGTIYSDVVGSLSVPDIYANAVLDYILYRAFSKDAEYAGNEGRAQGAYSAFANALGMEIKTTIAVQPQMKPGAGPLNTSA